MFSLAIETELEVGDARLGDSISVSGACLTLVGTDRKQLWFDVSAETLGCTRLGQLLEGDQVNLELAMLASDRYGGHFVTGHVDCLGKLTERENSARSVRMVFRCDNDFARLIAKKGSVCVDGVSLTVNRILDAKKFFQFEVNIIPHTLQVYNPRASCDWRSSAYRV